jgi:Ca2+-transporting ATPase
MALMLVAAAAPFLHRRPASRRNRPSAIAPVLAVDVFLEARSRQALKKLAAAVAPRARVLRDGEAVEIPTERIVPGDVLLLREGDVLHADGEIAWSSNLSTDESMLTGESVPNDKPPGAWFFAGSRVLTGQGGGVAASTGLNTEYGKIAHLVAEATTGRTPIQEKTDRLVGSLGRAAAVVAGAVFLLAWWRGHSLAGAFVSAISVAMAAMPEEFPLVFTLFLSLGAWRLARRRVLVRRIASVETLGSTTVICTDKTGTLTRGEFVLEAAVPEGGFTETDLLEAAVLACEIDPADPIEIATLDFARAAGLDPGALHGGGRLVRDHDWDPLGKHMTHVWKAAAGSSGLVVAAKGAFEGIVEHCALSPERLREAEARHGELAAGGLRVLAVAGKEEGTDARQRSEDEKDLALLGFLGFRDPLRPEIAAAVAECRSAGIRIKLVTGDHPVTARAIAESAGIARSDAEIVTGDALASLDPAAFDTRVAEAAVFARIRPEQKYAIIDSLRRRGEVVAMAGDGINDAPALSRASIGISMGERATEVARAAADIVLLTTTSGRSSRPFARAAHLRQSREILPVPSRLSRADRRPRHRRARARHAAPAPPGASRLARARRPPGVRAPLRGRAGGARRHGPTAAPARELAHAAPGGGALDRHRRPAREHRPTPLRDIPAARRGRGSRDRARRPRAGHPLDRLGRRGRAFLESRGVRDGASGSRAPVAEHSRAPRHPGYRGDPSCPVPGARTMGDRARRGAPPSSGEPSAEGGRPRHDHR